MQNKATTIAQKQDQYWHKTYILQDPNWLPIFQYRIQFEILLLIYKSICDEGPAYLASMLEYRLSRRLRSAG